MVAAVVLGTGVAGCGQKGALFLDPSMSGAPRPMSASSSPAGVQGTDPLSTPSTETITPPVTFPASPVRPQ